MSSYDGSRSARQSKRYSMSALYMSMSANESDLVIEDELAKGAFLIRKRGLTVSMILTALQHKRFCGI
jgi:Ras GTPase-activating-like protein IQGAP2/3